MPERHPRAADLETLAPKVASFPALAEVGVAEGLQLSFMSAVGIHFKATAKLDKEPFTVALEKRLAHRRRRVPRGLRRAAPFQRGDGDGRE